MKNIEKKLWFGFAIYVGLVVYFVSAGSNILFGILLTYVGIIVAHILLVIYSMKKYGSNKPTLVALGSILTILVYLVRAFSRTTSQWMNESTLSLFSSLESLSVILVSSTSFILLMGTFFLFLDKEKEISRERRQEIEFRAHHDFLTSQYNRYYFFKAYEEMDDSRYFPLGIMMFDLNGLKIINDAFGHEIGDQAINAISVVLNNTFEAKDVIARIGGDEFAVIVPNTTNESMQKYKIHIRESVNMIKIQNVELSIAIGYELKTHLSENIDDVFKKAENETYRHKTIEGSSVRSRAINAILNTLTDKYETEKKHSIEVSKFSKLIGLELKLRGDEIIELEQAGMFHDIGKISMPDEILNKPGKLTDKEFEIIKTHTEIGYQILRAADEYSDLAIHALHHHERWDGKGYPRGLKGEDIPLFSRIICVVDSYEAMTADRPYRKKLSKEFAISEIIKCSGSQFDPKIAKLFVENVLKSTWK